MAKKTPTTKSKSTAKSKAPKAPRRPLTLPPAWHILVRTTLLMRQHWRVLLGSTAVYLVLNVVLVQGLSATATVPAGNASTGTTISSTIASASRTIGGNGGAAQASGVYQSTLLVLFSLAIIWTLRMVVAGTSVRVRDGYYRGMTPLVPALLVLLVVGLQLIPLLAGSSLYTTVITNGIALGLTEKIFWGMTCGLIACISLFWLSYSLFALYIVTLPEMTPVKALRSARELVRGHRLLVLRKILFLPLALVIAMVIILAPFVAWLPGLVAWVFIILTSLAILVAHGYMYLLYRELLNE